MTRRHNRRTTLVSLLCVGALALTLAGTASAEAAPRPGPPASEHWKLDETFGTGGVVLTDFGYGSDPYSRAFATRVQPDGRILVGGVTSDFDDGTDVASLARYRTNGTLDASFGDGGRVVIGPHWLYAVEQVALQRIEGQPKIVLAVSTTFRSPTRYRCSVIRLNSDGSLDTDHDADPAVVFGTEGVRVIRFADNAGFCPDLTVTSTGAIVGVVEAGSHRGDVGLFRLRPEDGSLDPTFGGDGKMTIVSRGFQVPNSLALQPRPGQAARIVVGGLVSLAHGYDWALWRITPDGRLDRSFGDDGRVVTPMRDPKVQQSFDTVDSLVVTPDRHIVAGGRYRAWPDHERFPQDTVGVAEYLPDGTLDTSFGDGGRAHLTWDGAGETEALDITVDDAGGVFYTGEFAAPTYSRYLLGGFEADGSPDTRFSGDGFVRFTVGSGGAGYAITEDASGRLVAAGVGGDPSGGLNDVFGVVRLRLTAARSPTG